MVSRSLSHTLTQLTTVGCEEIGFTVLSSCWSMDTQSFMSSLESTCTKKVLLGVTTSNMFSLPVTLGKEEERQQINLSD